jgi:O-antigen ligase
VIGGGGSPAPLPELALELLAVLILLVWLMAPATREQWRRIPVPARLVAALALALPILQLVPLPPALWQALPGRDLQREALALIDLDQTWRPISLAPQRTLASLLALLPPLLMLALTSTLDRAARVRLVAVALGVGVLSLLLGALQLTGGASSPAHLYEETRPVLSGFQANRNSTADFLLVAMLAVPLLVRLLVEQRRMPDSRILVLGLTAGGLAVFALGVVLTGSRTGIVLLPLPLIASLVLLRAWLPLGQKHLMTGIGGALALAVLALLLVRFNPTLASVAERFDFSRELRPQLWRDGWFVAQKYFPFGVGMGDFVPALLADERLEAVRPFLPNRAHNDYLELAAEAGIAGILALIAAAWLIAREGWRAWSDPQRNSAGLVLFAGSGLTIFALHSMVDYPFRSMSMASLGAVCAGLLMAPRPAPGPGDSE